MKKDNFLYEVIYNDRTYYFTKMKYISRLTGMQPIQIQRALVDDDYCNKHNLEIAHVDGSEIKYKDINILPV